MSKDWVNDLAKARRYMREKTMPETMGVIATLAGNNRWSEASQCMFDLAKEMMELDGPRYKALHEPVKGEKG